MVRFKKPPVKSFLERPHARQTVISRNFSDDPSRSDPRFDDGGFFFMPEDPVQNKAGIAGVDRFGRRFVGHLPQHAHRQARDAQQPALATGGLIPF